MKPESIGVFGAAFNPPHKGHLDALHQVASDFDHLIVVPSYRHAWGKVMVSFDLRMAMVKALLLSYRGPAIIAVSDLEQELASRRPDDEPVYTYDVLNALQACHPGSRLTFLCGPDNADPSQWRRFFKADEIQTRWTVRSVKERRPVRSTAIREALAVGSNNNLSGLPEPVRALIRQHHLYGAKTAYA